MQKDPEESDHDDRCKENRKPRTQQSYNTTSEYVEWSIDDVVNEKKDDDRAYVVTGLEHEDGYEYRNERLRERMEPHRELVEPEVGESRRDPMTVMKVKAMHTGYFTA